jgi:hypothetical protein
MLRVLKGGYTKMEIRNFEEDFTESNKPTLREEWVRVLKNIFGQEATIDFKEEKNIQIGLGTDVTIKQKNGRRFSVELKTKRFNLMPYDSWVLELKHHIYSDMERKNKIESKDGWLYTSTAEYVIYATLNEERNKIVEVCGFSLVPFKYEDFRSEITKLPVKFAYTEYSSVKHQTTVFCLAKTEWIRENANKFWYWKE